MFFLYALYFSGCEIYLLPCSASIADGELPICLPGIMMLYVGLWDKLEKFDGAGLPSMTNKRHSIILPLFKELYGCWELVDLE